MRRCFDWVFRDRASGAIVIAQWPNLPLWLFAMFAAAAWFSDSVEFGQPEDTGAGLRLLSALCLGWWALDEVFRGVNPWRRFLGVSVLVFGLWRISAHL